MEKKVIGIIGGMGPLATADLFQKIVLHTRAASDQEHLHILIDNNTDIPDRTAAILRGGENPLPQMVKSAKWLEAGGAGCLIMPCNTAHYYHAQLQSQVHIPVLNMIELTCRAMADRGISRAGLLATTGAVQSGIYQEVFRRGGVSLLAPEEGEQEEVMGLIYDGVKAGRAAYDTAPVLRAVRRLFDEGAEVMILGCTELPLAVQLYGMDFPAIDPTLELAKGAIRFAGGEVC